MGRPRKHNVAVGDRFGTRVVTAELPKRGPHRMFAIMCDCGRASTAEVQQLTVRNHGCSHRCVPGGLDNENPADFVRLKEHFHSVSRDEQCEIARRLRFDEGLKLRTIADRLGVSHTLIARLSVKGQ